jgi:hypothetical protein
MDIVMKGEFSVSVETENPTPLTRSHYMTAILSPVPLSAWCYPIGFM